jgi:hypothetical protein
VLVERDLRARFPDGMLAPHRRSVPGGHAPPALRASIPRTLKCQSQPQTTARAFLEMLLTIPAASGRTSMNEAETTAVMGRRCRPQLRAGARVRAGAHARRGGARVCAHMRAPGAHARTRARLSLPNTPWSANRIGHETLDLGCWMLEAPIRLRPYLPAASASSGLWMPKLGFRYRIVRVKVSAALLRGEASRG